MEADNNQPVYPIVGVRFTKGGRIYLFDARYVGEVRMHDNVIVETVRGWQMGEIVQMTDTSNARIEGEYKRIDRIATNDDKEKYLEWQAKEAEVTRRAKQRSNELRLNQIKIIGSEYSFDGSRVAILFSTDSDEKVDLKSLRGDMQRLLQPALVELRSVGPRDVAKIIGGIGACGLEKRCCSGFLNDFSSISIKMAKEQGISLSPTEITGMCGRLRCCLNYEYETYKELRSGLPKRGKRISTPFGEGKVLDVSPLMGTLRIDIPEVGIKEFRREDLISETEVGSQSSLKEVVVEDNYPDFAGSNYTLVKVDPPPQRSQREDAKQHSPKTDGTKNQNQSRSHHNRGRFNRRGNKPGRTGNANSES